MCRSTFSFTIQHFKQKKKEKFSDFFISLSILYKYLAENLYFIDHKYLFLAVTPSYNKEKHLNRS